MDERARIPVSLPRANPTQSYWQSPPAAIADLRTTEHLPFSAHTVIIGSGITGAAVAWNLLQNPDAKPGSILMLESRQVCSGATGRNGGHTKAASYRSFLHHAATLGTPTATQIALLEHTTTTTIHTLATHLSIPCASKPTSTIDIIFDPAEWAAAHTAIAALQAALPAGHPAAAHTFLTPEEVRQEYFVHDGVLLDGQQEERVQGGVRYAAGSLSAYEFVVGVLERCVERGMGLQTGTGVTGLRRVESEIESGDGDGDGKDGKWVVETARGTVRARRVVLATNGYTAGVWKRFQGVVVPLRGQVTVHRPGKGMPFGGCLPTTYSFIYENGYEYMVTRPEGSRGAGDVVMGGGLVRAPDEGLLEFGETDDTVVNEGISEYLRETTPRYFGPDWGEDDPEGRMKSEWTGIMGFSPDGFPFVGEVPGENGLWTSCSFQGHGMVLCWMCAKALVEMMEGRDGEELKVWFPDIFRITEERLTQRFQGRLDTGGEPKAAE